MEKPCDIAHGELTAKGYIRVQRRIGGKRKKVRAHREAWEKANGPIPEGLFVLHKCDNRACREITHLFLGTHQDNMDDCVAKGRIARGETTRHFKLLEKDVREIRSSELSGLELAEKFGVAPSVISRVRTFKTWRHVD